MTLRTLTAAAAAAKDLPKTYEELRSRGVEFPQPLVEPPFGWWSMFEDLEGNRVALTPRE